ncbi:MULTISPECIES: hypothetical protein [Rhodococcus]|uniref:hypothetical protein n=1 Tax=Rhodococcus TaxID=1827 RepID=UPI001327F3F4|nr:hypothetical protein [Rhodococcus pyridinivorans]MXQ78855.1 hypothetical protein [Rhodococcus rhodochrous]
MSEQRAPDDTAHDATQCDDGANLRIGTPVGGIGIISAEPQVTAHIKSADNLHYVN